MENPNNDIYILKEGATQNTLVEAISKRIVIARAMASAGTTVKFNDDKEQCNFFWGLESLLDEISFLFHKTL